MNVFIDIETLPEQPEAEAKARIAETIKPPGTIKKAETIAEWHSGGGKYAGVKDAAINEQYLKTSFDGGYGSICAIVVDVNDKQLTFNIADFDYGESILNEEGLMLSAFWIELENELNKRPPYFIAHNASFDLPFLWKRSVINGTKPLKFKPNGRHGSDYFCTMTEWAGYNGMIGMDRLAKILGIKGKEGMTGADVWPEFQKGNTDKILEYCADDVRMLKEIYGRLTFNG